MKSREHKIKIPPIIKGILVCFYIFFIISLVFEIYQGRKYDQAKELYEDGKYEEALERFDNLGFYSDSLDFSVKASMYIEYQEAINYLETGANYEKAWKIFSSLKKKKKSKYYWEIATFKYARQLFDEGKLDEASNLFLSIIDYVDEESGEDAKTFYAKSMIPAVNDISETIYNSAKKEYNEKNYKEAYKEFLELNGYEESAEWVEKCRAKLAQEILGHTFSAGIRYSIAINKDYEIKITGDISSKNRDFLLNIENKEDIKSISGFSSTVAVLMENGKVIASSDYDLDTDYVESWSDIIAIATGDQFIVGLDKDGNIFGAGHPNDGQIEFDEWDNIISFDTAWRRTVGVDVDGNIYITGYGAPSHRNEIEKANRIAQDSNDGEIQKMAWDNIVSVATGGGYGVEHGHTVGLKSDGTVVAVGDNEHNQLEVSEWEHVISIAAGDYHTVGLTSTGKVLYAGDRNDKYVDQNGYVKGWNNIVAIAAGKDYTLALTSEGDILSFGYDKQDQRPTSSEWNNIIIYDWVELKEIVEQLITQ